jgi:hypothetical protein
MEAPAPAQEDAFMSGGSASSSGGAASTSGGVASSSGGAASTSGGVASSSGDAASSSGGAAAPGRPERSASDGSAGKRARGQSGPEVGRKRKKLNPVADDLPTSTAPPAVLVHKNRELAVAARRLRLKLRRSNQRCAASSAAAAEAEGAAASMARAMDEFLRAASELLGAKASLAVGDLEAAVAAGSAGGPLADALFGVELRQSLLRRVTALVPELKEEEDDDEEDLTEADADAKMGAAAREASRVAGRLPQGKHPLSQRVVRRMLALLGKVVDALAGGRAPELAARLVAEDEPAATRVALRRAQAVGATLVDRVLSLEATVRRLRAQAEDADNEKDVMYRRLAAVCNEALSDVQVATMADKMGIEVGPAAGSAGGAGPDAAAASASSSSSSSAAAAAAAAAAGAHHGGAASSAGQSDGEFERLAADRLQELEKVLGEKKELFDEIEQLRAAAAVPPPASAPSSTGSAGAPAASLAEDVLHLRLECARLAAELNLARQQRETAVSSFSDARGALEEAVKQAERATREREADFAGSANEKDMAIGALRSKLEASRAECKLLLGAQAKADEYAALVAALEARAARLEANLARAKGSGHGGVNGSATPNSAARAAAAAAAAATTAASPAPSVAELNAELERVRGELATSESYQEELINEVQSVSDTLKAIEEQNARLLRAMDEKEAAAKKWSSKVLDMNEQLNKVRNQSKLATQQSDKDRQHREAADGEFRQLQHQVAMLQQATAVAEEVAQASHARAAQAASDADACKAAARTQELERVALNARIDELAKSNAAFRKERDEATFAKNRAEEDRRKAKKKLERDRGERDANAPTPGAGDLRGEAMENALRCPLRSEYWKDAIITKCSHMFSRKALEDNLAKRNRKCPSCKQLFSKDDIREIYLYQSNEYDD